MQVVCVQRVQCKDQIFVAVSTCQQHAPAHFGHTENLTFDS